jgi:hypothetical protein
MDSIDDATSARVPGYLDDLLSRKELLRLGAAVIGGAAGCSLLWPSAARADDDDGPDDDEEHSDHGRARAPRPTPGGFNADLTGFVPENPLIHALAPAVGLEMSTITDFKGVVAGCELQGGAHSSEGRELWFDADMRFMKGVYIDLHGRRREHAFGFV